MITLRQATLHDLTELRKVAIASYQDAFAPHNSEQNMQSYLDNAYSLQALENDLREPESITILAEEDGRIIGFARLRRSDEVYGTLGDNTIELQRLYVLTQAHGKSVGSSLLEATLSYARDRHYEWMWLGVWERNFKAQAFYEKWGFEKFSEHTFWMGDDPQIDWLLKKKL